ncbi:MAG: proline racemase family protein [Vicinamibacterales bacterium]|mgnify:FL=1|jgi:proline racemase|nr:proline racemase [Acidobacteriota bacterium]MDP6372112.1 proline racemase family protein [Vicinamibacterales bacterium]MDP6608695.1 proline racemase family protein [Vicinamibacterales bacterium]HAK57332.1 proline racemase [Acidobacteriota bacterium]|tara:strand:+ start:2088 stop:3098 length:1011 start_codon:yes stop_codon:yes gene_type:complete
MPQHRPLRTIDAHAAGEPLRLVVDGFPAPEGETMLEKRAWVREHHDALRRALMFEPRGHAGMYGAVLTEAATEGSHAGILFMHNEGYSTMCGHGIVAVVTIALERGLLHLPAGEPIVLDSPAGPITARASVAERAGALRVDHVAFVNVPSFVLHPGLSIRLDDRQVPVDVAFGGAFYAIVDAEAAGLGVGKAHLGALREAGMAIKRSVEAQVKVVHPLDDGLEGIYGTIFTGMADAPDADLRNVTIFADAQVDRSPCGTGTSAVMAVLDAMSLLADDQAFTHESLIGTTFRGRIVGRTEVGEYPAIVPEIEGSAWITGEHTFLIDDDDPLKEGFLL